MKLNQKKKKKKTHVPFRLNMLFFVVFLLFSILVLRLGVVQIVYGDDYKREIERTEDVTINNPVPRGIMFDRNGKVIVSNTPENAITYTNSGASQKEMLEVAEKLAGLIEVEPNKVQERDKKDYWLILNSERGNELVTEEEHTALKEELETKEYNKKVYSLKLERITAEHLNELTAKDLEILAIYRAFTSGYALTPQIVKNEGVSDEEFARVSENLQSLPGVNTTTDWVRAYNFGSTLRSVLGNVSEGIPLEQTDYYLARDYNLNDRVGKSYIEMQYEDVLHGQKEKVKNITDKAGNVLETQVIAEGQRGSDLVLSIDMDLQLAVEQIIEEELLSAKTKANTGFLDRAFVVLMDPNTGDVLTMAGKQIVKDSETGKSEMRDFALGNITTSYTVGSTVKGATVLTGYQNNVIRPGSTFYDGPIKIRGTQEKSSWKNFGTLNDQRALRVSSNVYMFRTAMEIANAKYVPNQPLPFKQEAFDIMRESFSQFGLGVRTGIDLPNEAIGYKGSITHLPGLLLDFSIGQYDTYTPMQLAQYVSTIANGGYRVQPHIVKEIRAPLMETDQLGPLLSEIKPTVLNRLDLESGWIEVVQEGFRQVMQHPEGTGYGKFHTAAYLPAGKTGTAQAFYDGPDRSKYKEAPSVINLSLVGYAPYNNPEVAMSVVVPWAYTGKSGPSVSTDIGRKVLDAYFDLKKIREDEKLGITQTEEIDNMVDQEEQS